MNSILTIISPKELSFLLILIFSKLFIGYVFFKSMYNSLFDRPISICNDGMVDVYFYMSIQLTFTCLLVEIFHLHIHVIYISETILNLLYIFIRIHSVRKTAIKVKGKYNRGEYEYIYNNKADLKLAICYITINIIVTVSTFLYFK